MFPSIERYSYSGRVRSQVRVWFLSSAAKLENYPVPTGRVSVSPWWAERNPNEFSVLPHHFLINVPQHADIPKTQMQASVLSVPPVAKIMGLHMQQQLLHRRHVIEFATGLVHHYVRCRCQGYGSTLFWSIIFVEGSQSRLGFKQGKSPRTLSVESDRSICWRSKSDAQSTY